MSVIRKLIGPFLNVFALLLCCIGYSSYGQQKAASALGKEDVLNRIADAASDSAKAYWQLELGRALIAEKKYDEAIHSFQQSLLYNERVKNWPAIAKAKGNIGICYSAKLDMKTATTYLEEARVAAEKVDDKRVLSTIYSGLIGTYNSAGSTAKGLEYAQKLISLGKAEGDQGMIGRGYYYIGYFYHLNNNMDKAMQHYTTALGHYQTVNDTTMIASLQINLGEYYLSIKQMDSAKIYFNRSLQTAVRNNDKVKMAALYERLGIIYATEDDYPNILRLADKSLALARELDNRELMSFYAFQLERVRLANLIRSVTFVDSKPILTEVQRKSLDSIAGNMEAQFKVYRKEALNYAELSRMSATMSYVQQLTGNYEAALTSYAAYVAYNDSFSNAENLKQFANVEARYAFEKSKDSLRLIEEQKRLELRKEIELNALKFEFEKKKALAKTEAERAQLLFEEELKRKAIEAEYARNRDAAQARYRQELALAKANEEKERALSLAELRRSNNARNMSLLGAGLLLVLSGGAVYAYTQKRKDNKKIAVEKQRSDDLLLNILPAEIAEELKLKGESKAQQSDEASVLFTDFVSFTRISEQLGVEELLQELNINFTAFDRIMEKHGLEKIKTIGDAYLAVSGLPVAHPRHAQQAVNAALDILDFVAERKKIVPYGLDIRIGIHSGPLIAGIIGVKKFAYDIWGDTVNTAARMEQSGISGRVNISEMTYQRVKDEFTCQYRGKIDAKNKGEMDMYLVEGGINNKH